MMVMTSDLPDFEQELGGSAPWDGEAQRRHLDLSPITYACHVRTPVLILHGEKDARVPLLTVFYSPHMTSPDNEARRASGHADVPLSPLGRQQAQELGQHYASAVLDAIFCSDLQRATITAQLAFAGQDVPLVPDARLRECDYGDMTRAPVAQVEEELPRRIREPFPHGESVLMVVERVGAFLYDALQQYDGKTIVVIGHRATRYGLEYWCGDDTLEEIVHKPWKWRSLPVWRYKLTTHTLSGGQDHIPKSVYGRGL